MRYFLLVTGHDCALYAKQCYQSIMAIDFPGQWEATFIDDGSTDDTKKVLEDVFKQHPHNNIHLSTCHSNMGAAYRRHEYIDFLSVNGLLQDEDVIMFIGMDDRVTPDCLSTIHPFYTKYDKWMTYGNYQDQFGVVPMTKNNLYFSDDVHRNRSYRKELYRSTAINTFKYFLYKQIPVDDLKVNGEWQKVCTETEVMFSCLEMCGKNRIGVVEKPIYIYNRNLPNGTLNKHGREFKKSILEQIKSREPKQLLKQK